MGRKAARCYAVDTMIFRFGLFELDTDSEELLKEDSLPDPGCLVVDYHMPGMNGLELVAQLRGRDVLIPAILVTPDPSENLRSRAAAAGISIVEKPLLGNGLLDRIREACQR